MSEGIKLLKKIVRSRRYLIKTGKSLVPEYEVAPSLNKVSTWVEFYPYANDNGVRKFIKSNMQHIERIIPGSGSASGLSLLKQINQFCNQS
jgi:hypothetical protein